MRWPLDLFLGASGRACPAPTPRLCKGEASPRPRATCYPMAGEEITRSWRQAAHSGI